MPFGLCNTPAMFQRIMQNCLGGHNLMHCLIYLDNITVFLQMAEHLHHLHVVFDHFREHNLRLKPSKCDLFRSKINCLAHHMSKEGVCPSHSKLKAIAECTLPKTYTKVQAFLGLGGHSRWFIKGFV